MFQPLLGYSIQIIIPVIIVLCGGFLIPEASWGQITPRMDLPSQDRQEKFKDDPDIPVQGTEEQRGEEKQEDAKEEAINSLPIKGGLTVIPVPTFAYSRNEKAYYGFIVPIPQGE